MTRRLVVSMSGAVADTSFRPLSGGASVRRHGAASSMGRRWEWVRFRCIPLVAGLARGGNVFEFHI